MTELASRPNLQQSHSPLANLVRRTSSRRIKGREQFHWQQPEPIAEYDSAPPNDGRNQQKKLYVEIKGTLSSSTLSPPHSPLLHTHFARDSVATASSFDDNSYLDARSGSFQDDHSDYDYRHFEDARDRNVYVEAGLPSLRDPWRSTDKHAAIFHNHSSSDDRPSQQEQYPQQVKNSSPSVPSVFISLHDPSIDNSVDTAAIRGGPIVKPVTNFSRPIRESGQLEHSSAMGERVTPQLPPDMREQKRKVLERNARRGMAKSSGESMKTRSPLSQTSMDALSIDGSSSGWNQNHGQQGRSSPSTKDLKPQLSPIISSPHPQSKSGETGIRTVSPDSLYSAYSYYEYEKAATYPSGSQTPTRTSVVKQPQRPPSSTSSNRSSLRSPEGLRTPQEYLQLGIQHHEANRLRESARCFERSATEEGGCGVGMLMYGLSLRHGWGCARNEKAGFKWLRKAAEHAVEDLERVRMNGDMDVRVIETELVLAIYEVGQCFFQGWGVAKDQKMAVSYYTVAARLGDGDAQADLGFCLANGKGCKKDKKSSAKWYRAAVSQVYLMTTTPIKHTKFGLWDLYVEVDDHVPYIQWPAISFQPYIQSAPYVWRMIMDITSIPKCRFLLAAYVLIELAAALIPALTLSYSGQMLSIVQVALEQRTLDKSLLISVAFGAFASSLAGRILHHAKNRLFYPLRQCIKQYYSVHIFHAMSRLDVPTFDDPAIQRQLHQAVPTDHAHATIAFRAVTTTLRVFTTVIQVLSQLSVLINLLKGQPDGILLAFLSFAHGFIQWIKTNKPFISASVWAATSNNSDFLRSEGLKQTISDPIHRQEIVAAGIGPFLLNQYRESIARISDHASDFFEALSKHQQGGIPVGLFIEEILRALPEIVSTLRAVRQPLSIPLSFASLNIVTRTTTSFTHTLFTLRNDTASIADTLSSVRLLYEVAKIPNRVKVNHLPKEIFGKGPSETPVEHNPDTDDPLLGIPFPEDQQSLELGISVEFRQVSFKYPGSNTYALHNTSFKIERGQLCVIVGINGSGKSTILKLIARLYDPLEGEIRINGQDIRTLRLADLRNATSVLFQDYTVFPLNIRDNISLGDPPHSSDFSRVQKAAELGGADVFIERLPNKYDTYLERPVMDHYSSLPEGTRTRSGRIIDYRGVRDAGGIGNSTMGLSGGQMQRIALSRTFMRSVVSEGGPGLLLFDEPSASLDPTAEHDLFERLRQLRGNKTMIFSSHRFGNLTRHADLILYMNDSVVVEEGTHDQLLRQQGEYARIWMLQARAFI